MMPAKKHEECNCIRKKINRLKLTSPVIVTTKQLESVITECCKPPIVEQQEKEKGRRIFNPIQARRRVRKCLDSGGMWDMINKKCLYEDSEGQWG